MSKSRFVLDKFAKLIEQGLLSYKDLSEEMINILKSKRDEIVFKMKLTSKEEFDILNKRVSNLEKKLKEVKNTKSSKKTKRVKKL
jgi:BMFP domain-containing protein YqiC